MKAIESLVASSGYQDAFSVKDLVAVLAVVAVLGAIAPPSIANSKSRSDAATCLYNHRQLSRAWQLFAEENNGSLVGNLDGADVQTLANSNKTWALGWFDFVGGSAFPGNYGGRANTNTFVLTQISPLAPHLNRDAAAFKCPADTSLNLGTKGIPRVRSISMNGYIGERVGPFTTGYRQFKKISEILDPKPSQAFVFIDEREDSINDACFLLDMAGFRPLDPSHYTIVDYPADWHNRGANLSFADGHTETWRWSDRRTMPLHRRGLLIPLAVASPNNPDVARIQAATSSKLR